MKDTQHRLFDRAQVFSCENPLILGAFRAEYRMNQSKYLRTLPKGGALT